MVCNLMYIQNILFLFFLIVSEKIVKETIHFENEGPLDIILIKVIYITCWVRTEFIDISPAHNLRHPPRAKNLRVSLWNPSNGNPVWWMGLGRFVDTNTFNKKFNLHSLFVIWFLKLKSTQINRPPIRKLGILLTFWLGDYSTYFAYINLEVFWYIFHYYNTTTYYWTNTIFNITFNEQRGILKNYHKNWG